jgi:SOS-response transcriptional repressor LexA
MGDITPMENKFIQTSMPDDNGKQVSVVKINFSMNHPVEDSIYDYLTFKPEAKNEYIEPITIEETSPPFRILSRNEVKPFKNCIPLYDIKAAAGDFSELQSNEETEWIELNSNFKYSEDYFVCKVIGESMNKVIPNNSWCLFKKDSGGSRNDKIVLVHQSNFKDSDFGNGYTVKSYESNKTVSEEGYQHNSIILKPKSDNPDFKNIILNDDALINFKVVGIFVEVLK